MSEIEKMYENAGVEKPCTRPKDLICATFRPDGLYRCTNGCYNCIYLGEYSPFTAEKQIELYCFILSQEKYVMTFEATLPLTHNVFAEGIAKATNALWQSLTEERKQIKEILK